MSRLLPRGEFVRDEFHSEKIKEKPGRYRASDAAMFRLLPLKRHTPSNKVRVTEKFRLPSLNGLHRNLAPVQVQYVCRAITRETYMLRISGIPFLSQPSLPHLSKETPRLPYLGHVS